MKKLFSVLMLLSFASMIVCCQEDLNKKLAYETLTDISNGITNGIKGTVNGIAHGIKGTVKAAIPGCTVACLVHEACEENDYSKINKIQGRFCITVMKSSCASCFLSLAKTVPVQAFLGAHAISGLVAILGYNFAEKKYQYLYLKELDDEHQKKMAVWQKKRDNER